MKTPFIFRYHLSDTNTPCIALKDTCTVCDARGSRVTFTLCSHAGSWDTKTRGFQGPPAVQEKAETHLQAAQSSSLSCIDTLYNKEWKVCIVTNLTVQMDPPTHAIRLRGIWAPWEELGLSCSCKFNPAALQRREECWEKATCVWINCLTPSWFAFFVTPWKDCRLKYVK